MAERYVENDIGRALTSDQMEEYRQACEARAAGRESRRLTVSANVSMVVIVGLVVVGIVASVLSK